MALKIPAVGEDAMLKDLLGVTTPGNLTINLYVNDVTPADGDTAASYTAMSTHGYAAKTIAPGAWTVAQAAGVAEATAAPLSWVFTAGTAVSVHGYFMTSADGVVRWAERFSTSFVAEFLNDSITITPRFTLSST